VLFTRAKVVIAGDAIATREGESMLGVFNSDPGPAVASFGNLAELDVDVVCVGHGDPILTSGRDRLANAVASRRS
jgi:glyoxylase-like metal-dependent hydrolase (beta-lactamase superfamily II)